MVPYKENVPTLSHDRLPFIKSLHRSHHHTPSMLPQLDFIFSRSTLLLFSRSISEECHILVALQQHPATFLDWPWSIPLQIYFASSLEAIITEMQRRESRPFFLPPLEIETFGLVALTYISIWSDMSNNQGPGTHCLSADWPSFGRLPEAAAASKEKCTPRCSRARSEKLDKWPKLAGKKAYSFPTCRDFWRDLLSWTTYLNNDQLS